MAMIVCVSSSLGARPNSRAAICPATGRIPCSSMVRALSRRAARSCSVTRCAVVAMNP
jgi:hypothetical protein